MMKWCFQGLFSYNPQKYIHEKFLLFNPQKFPTSKLIHYTVVRVVFMEKNIILWSDR